MIGRSAVGARRRSADGTGGVLPTFLVIGAMKSGTDSLWRYLRAHPQVHMSDTKELDFFASELNWNRGLGWYRARFSPVPSGALAIGEASTSYSKFPVHAGVAERIARTLPDVRIVYLVRDPIERIRSQYLHQVLLRLENRPIERAVLDDPSYVAFSSYAMQLDRYLGCIPQQRILVMTTDRLLDDRRRTVERILRFIGVSGDADPAALEQRHHTTADKRVPRRGFDALLRVPGYAALSRHAPERLRRATAGVRTRGLPTVQGASIDDAVRRELRAGSVPTSNASRACSVPRSMGGGCSAGRDRPPIVPAVVRALPARL